MTTIVSPLEGGSTRQRRPATDHAVTRTADGNLEPFLWGGDGDAPADQSAGGGESHLRARP